MPIDEASLAGPPTLMGDHEKVALLTAAFISYIRVVTGCNERQAMEKIAELLAITQAQLCR